MLETHQAQKQRTGDVTLHVNRDEEREKSDAKPDTDQSVPLRFGTSAASAVTESPGSAQPAT
jgi:hypothetical protein